MYNNIEGGGYEVEVKVYCYTETDFDVFIPYIKRFIRIHELDENNDNFIVERLMYNPLIDQFESVEVFDYDDDIFDD
jgi:hypothetical protein